MKPGTWPIRNQTSVAVVAPWSRAIRPKATGSASRSRAASMDAARALGFTRMNLDVVPERRVAIAMYRALGFEPVEPAHEYPFKMVYLARDL